MGAVMLNSSYRSVSNAGEMHGVFSSFKKRQKVIHS